MYGVIGGITKSIKYTYGVIASVTRKIKKIYGVVGGVTKLIWEAVPESGEIVFTSSGTFTVPSGITNIDIFCVGGGGGAGGSYYQWWYLEDPDTTEETYYEAYSNIGVSGAGGYTSTKLALSVSPGDILTVTVGAGGVGGNSVYTYDHNYNDRETNGISSTTIGSTGGTSSVAKNGSNIIVSYGGSGGTRHTSYNQCIAGVAGGSGSGAYSYSCWGNNTSNSFNVSGSNGSDGSDGEDGERARGYMGSGSAKGGTGQGTTTRYFAETEGTLYSSAGNSSYKNPSYNTGHGGSRTAGYISWENYGKTKSPSGASGCVIIRWSAA